jgi:hypothetical protein
LLVCIDLLEAAIRRTEALDVSRVVSGAFTDLIDEVPERRDASLLLGSAVDLLEHVALHAGLVAIADAVPHAAGVDVSLANLDRLSAFAAFMRPASLANLLAVNRRSVSVVAATHL